MTYKPVPLAERCEEDFVPYGGRMVTGHRCSRRWKVEEEGKKWCRQHAPSTLEARLVKGRQRWAARQARFQEEAARQRETERRAALFPDLLAALEGLWEAYTPEVYFKWADSDYKGPALVERRAWQQAKAAIDKAKEGQE